MATENFSFLAKNTFYGLKPIPCACLMSRIEFGQKIPINTALSGVKIRETYNNSI